MAPLAWLCCSVKGSLELRPHDQLESIPGMSADILESLAVRKLTTVGDLTGFVMYNGWPDGIVFGDDTKFIVTLLTARRAEIMCADTK